MLNSIFISKFSKTFLKQNTRNLIVLSNNLNPSIIKNTKNLDKNCLLSINKSFYSTDTSSSPSTSSTTTTTSSSDSKIQTSELIIHHHHEGDYFNELIFIDFKKFNLRYCWTSTEQTRDKKCFKQKTYIWSN